MNILRLLWQQNRWLLLGFGAALLLSLFFGIRALVFALDPVERDQVIEPWMTPRYVSMSWHVPREVMLAAIGTDGPPEKGGPQDLREIAAAQGIPVEALIAAIEAEIAAFRTCFPEGPDAPPPPANCDAWSPDRSGGGNP